MRLLLYLLLLFTFNTGYCEFDIKQGALTSTERFFKIRDQKWIMDGRFVDTDSDFGNKCQIVIDLSKSTGRTLALKGEYEPRNTMGDGINFNLAPESFTEFESEPGRLLIKQAIQDSFSTGVETTVVLTKEGRVLHMTVEIESRFLFIPSVVKKTCEVNDFITYQ